MGKRKGENGKDGNNGRAIGISVRCENINSTAVWIKQNTWTA